MNRRDAAWVLAGLALWVGFAAWSVPSLLDPAWAQALIVFAALVLMPLGWPLVNRKAASAPERLCLPCGILLAVSFRQPPGMLALGLAVPWVLLLSLRAGEGLRALAKGPGSPSRLAGNAGLAYGLIGGAWLIADRIGLRPLGFDPAIVLLTAAHFHVAGVILPLVTGCLCRRISAPTLAWSLALAAVLGVFLVAIGITATRLGQPAAIEAIAAVALSFVGFVVALAQLRLATLRELSLSSRLCLGLSACALLSGMALSALYGIRSFERPVPWLDIPHMRALHGSVNAIGFGFFATLGWRLAEARGD